MDSSALLVVQSVLLVMKRYIAGNTYDTVEGVCSGVS